MPRPRVLLLVSFCALLLTRGAAQAAQPEAGSRDRDLKRAEAVLDKLRRLDSAAGSAPDLRPFRAAADGLYPGILVQVSELPDGALKTDLATAVALYESARRLRADAPAPDCRRELRASYLRLCRESAGGGGRAALLFAKARMHARWAEVALSHRRGDAGAATLAALDEIRAERRADLILARRALAALKSLAEGFQSPPAVGDDGDAARPLSASTAVPTDAELSAALDGVDLLLASLPRDRAQQLLRNARNHLRDALALRRTALAGTALTVSARALGARERLDRPGLDAAAAARAYLQNRRGALNFIRRAEEALEETQNQ